MSCMELNLSDVERILQHQRNYFNTNATKDVTFRIRQLKALKTGLKKHEKNIERALYQDLGKHKNEAYMTEIGLVYSNISHMIKNLKKWDRPEKASTPIHLFPGKSYTINEPYGAVLILGAFNYPVQLALEPLIGAIAAGNTAVVKPSELAAHTSEALRKMIQDTFQKRYVMCVEGGTETADALVSSKFDYIFFTGSTAIGKRVMESAAKNLVPVTLELGGKCPVIVDKNANIKEAARRIIWGKTLNAGQTCVAPDYVLVHESVEDNLIEQMKEALEKYYRSTGEKNRDFGRIINRRHFDRITALIDDERENLIFGGKSNAETRYIEPTIIKIKSFDSEMMREEIFGPVLPILGYKDIEEVISKLKVCSKPLALYIFTKDKALKTKLIKEVSSGNVCVNDTVLHTSNNRLPFGGVGGSGMGLYHGKYSYETFSHKKGVLDKNPHFTNTLIYPPFGEKKLKTIKRFLK